MLHFARQQVGKPFSGVGMARSLIWPRRPDGSSWFCAELVAACLQTGGLLNRESNPGAATPHNLFKLYKGKGATTANPFMLRNQCSAVPGRLGALPPQTARRDDAQRRSLLGDEGGASEPLLMRSGARCQTSVSHDAAGPRSGSPPRVGLKVLHAGTSARRSSANVALSLRSLNVGAR